MRKVLVRPRTVWLVFLFLILQLSCAQRERLPLSSDHEEPLPPPAEVRENLGTIGVASGCFKPECSLEKQKSTTSVSKLAAGAAKGAGKGAGEVLDAGCVTGARGSECIALVLAPFGACIGCLVGAAKSEATEKSDAKSDATLRNAFEQVNLQDITRDNILRIASKKTSYTFVNLGDQGPTTPAKESDYSFLASEGIDTVLEIAVLEAVLVGSEEIYPDLQFFMNLRVRIIRVRDGERLYVGTLTHKGKRYLYSMWAADNAALLREELKAGCEKLSERVVKLLFISPSSALVSGVAGSAS
jgi:hypothetical protein